jgi:hypothetical protein
MKKIIAISVLALVALSASACGGKESPQGFNNPATLEGAIKRQAQEALWEHPDVASEYFGGNSTVDDVLCVEITASSDSSRRFDCRIAVGDYGESWKIVVSKDGSKWVGSDDDNPYN